MGRYLARRVGYTLLLCWLVVTLTFLLIELAPGDASLHFLDPDLPAGHAELMRARWGLDQPAALRYLLVLLNLARGDLGESLVQARPVTAILADTLPITLELGSLALLLGFGLGVPLGVWQALRAGRRAEGAVGLLALLIHAVPEFCLALALILVFAKAWPILPASGLHDVAHASRSAGGRLVEHARHLVLPLLTLVLPLTAWVARHQRASLLGVLTAPFVRTARGLGLSGRRVLLAHALPAALPPVLTIAGVALPGLVGGAVVVEFVFSLPGMGQLLVSSTLDRDSPVVIACFLVFALLVALGSTLADLGVAALDPRARERLVRRG